MAEVIGQFATRGPGGGLVHSPLSNFHVGDLLINGQIWPSVEHYFQAVKTNDPLRREAIRLASSPGEAKSMGTSRSQTVLRPDWEAIKIRVMRYALRHKFVPVNSEGAYLLNTGHALLIEGNDWGDRFWGMVNGGGENWLGHLLMARRAELRYLEVANPQ